MANAHKKNQAKTQKAKALPRGCPPKSTNKKVTTGRKSGKADSKNTPVEPVAPRPHPRPAYRGVKASAPAVSDTGLTTTHEQVADVQAAAIVLLDLAGNGNGAQFGAIGDETGGQASNRDETEEDIKASDGEDDEEVESVANSLCNFGEFIAIHQAINYNIN
jgi:hypothetical protein